MSEPKVLDLRHTDNRDRGFGLPSLMRDWVDLVFVDEPFGACEKQQVIWHERKYNSQAADWDQLPENTQFWADEVFRILRPGGVVYAKATFHNKDRVRNALRRSFGAVDLEHRLQSANEQEIILFMTNAMPLKFAKQAKKFAYTHETLFKFTKPGGDEYWNYDRLKEINDGRQMRDVWQICKPIGRARANHEAPTPPDVIKNIYAASLPRRGSVVDPFMGAGETALQIREYSGVFVGMELLKRHFDTTRKRLIVAGLGTKIEVRRSESGVCQPKTEPAS